MCFAPEYFILLKRQRGLVKSRLMPALFYGFRLIRRSRRKKTMSYVDEVIERVVAKNPAEPEFHQAVKEVLES